MAGRDSASRAADMAGLNGIEYLNVVIKNPLYTMRCSSRYSFNRE